MTQSTPPVQQQSKRCVVRFEYVPPRTPAERGFTRPAVELDGPVTMRDLENIYRAMLKAYRRLRYQLRKSGPTNPTQETSDERIESEPDGE